MPQQDRSFRPRIDSFEFLGAQLEIVDAAGLLRGGHPDDAQLLHGKGFPYPIRALSVSIATVTRDDIRFHEFRGRIQIAGDVPGQQSELVKALGPVAAPAAAAAAVIVGAAVPLAVAAASAYRARQRAAQQSANREATAAGGGPVRTVAQDPVGTAQDPGQAGPGSDTPGPGSNQAGPGSDTAGPGSDTAGPGSDQAGPGSDQAGPGSDQAGPGSDQAGPGSDQAGPGSDTAPGSDQAGPGSDRRASRPDRTARGAAGKVAGSRAVGEGRGGEPEQPVRVQDPVTGLVATVRRGRPGVDGRRTDTLVATVPGGTAEPTLPAAFVRVLLEAARRQAGRPDDRAFFAGRSYQLSRYPGGRWADPAAAGAVRLDQVGGLPEVVSQLREVAVSFRHPAAMARWGARRPQGILMYGPPGTGKTTLARALATEIGGTLREIRTPEILDKYVGQSERNIKRIFAEARAYRQPTVLLFDEFDSIISYTGAPTDAASQMVNSVAGIFKQEMNTLVEENPNVIVVATTNFPDRVDDSLIRSGRFDIKMTVPLPDTAARADIFTTILREVAGRYEVGGFRMFADDLDVAELAGLTAGMTGADFKEILRRAQLGKAMQDARGEAVSPINQADLRRHVAELRRLV